jgi:hypothetical protein
VSDKYTEQRLAILEELIAESLDAISKALGLMVTERPSDRAVVAHFQRTLLANAKIIRKIAEDGVP